MFKAILIIYGIGVVSGTVLTNYARKIINAYRKAEKKREEEFDKKVNRYAEQLRKDWSAQ